MALCRFGFWIRLLTKATVFLCKLTLFDCKRGLITCRPFSFCTMIWLIALETCEYRKTYQQHVEQVKLKLKYKLYIYRETFFKLISTTVHIFWQTITTQFNCDSVQSFIFSYNAFVCGEVLQRSTTGFLYFFLLARAQQRQVTLQSFGVDQPACPTRLWILNDWEVKVALDKKRNRLSSTCLCPLTSVQYILCFVWHIVLHCPAHLYICTQVCPYFIVEFTLTFVHCPILCTEHFHQYTSIWILILHTVCFFFFKFLLLLSVWK